MDRNEIIEHQLSRRLAKNKLPLVDVTARVMAGIDGLKPQRPVSARKPLWIAGIAAAILVISGFGYAMSAWQLQRADGSVSMEYRSFKPGEEPAHGMDAGELRKRLNPGEAAFFVTLNEAGKEEIIGIENYRVYTSLEQLISAADLPLRFADSLTDSMKFTEGHIVHSLENPDIALLRAELEQSGLDIYMKNTGLGDTEGAVAFYQNADGGKIRVDMFKGDSWRTIESSLKDEEIAKITIHNEEALAVTDRNTGERELHWMDERSGDPVYVKVSTATPGRVTEEELLAAARSILQ